MDTDQDPNPDPVKPKAKPTGSGSTTLHTPVQCSISYGVALLIKVVTAVITSKTACNFFYDTATDSPFWFSRFFELHADISFTATIPSFLKAYTYFLSNR
jgi:hypothetical protein